MKLLIIVALLSWWPPRPRCARNAACSGQFGFKVGSDGCPLCECNPQPVRRALPERCFNKPLCGMYCEFGFQTGADGCLVCKCNKAAPDCSKFPICMMYCANGYQTGLDGCAICKCK